MIALYITSLHTFSGKTALCLGIGRRLQADGHEVGYFKPLSTHPWHAKCGTSDEDADFVARTFGLPENPCELVGVFATEDLLTEALEAKKPPDLMGRIRAGFERIGKGRDVVLLEGAASLQEGFGLGLGAPDVAEALDARALAVTPYHDKLALLDDAMVAKLRLGDRLLGVVANRVREEDIGFVLDVAAPYLEKQGVSLLGALPLREELQAISVEELADVLGGEFLAMKEKGEALIENMVVGAMSVEQAMPRIRRVCGTKAVITGGDRADMQLVALETATDCLILTGNLHPVPEVLRRAEEAQVPVLLVRHNTLETVEAIERVFGKTRLGQEAKLSQFESLLAEHFDFEQLYNSLNL
jgi:BioD-like phosphotransacetylase family protein